MKGQMSRINSGRRWWNSLSEDQKNELRRKARERYHKNKNKSK